MDQLEQRYVLENQMVGGKSNQKRAGVYSRSFFYFSSHVFGSG